MSSTKKVGVSGKIIHSQGREIIANVYKFMKEEAERGATLIPLKNYKQRLMAAIGISDKVYRSVVKECEEVEFNPGSVFTSPRKGKVPAKKLNLPEADIQAIRKIIHNFYITDKRRPSLKCILNKIEEQGLSFNGNLNTLWRLLKKIGFRWCKTSDNRKALVESYDIRKKRIEYLKSIKKFREDGRTIIYTDETYIHSSHTNSNGWYDEGGRGLKAPISKGKRLIIVHAGEEMGFVSEALLIFPSGLKTGDYHNDMNQQNFEKWLITKCLPNMPQNCVFVMDNAPYHTVKVEKEPTSSTKKAEMQNWLQSHNIDYDITHTKPELYAVIKKHKNKNPKYRVDEILKANGHTPLRLPPYHPELNPIEKIWALVKNYVAARNVTFKMSDVQKLAENRFNEITANDWLPICEHVKKIENEYIQREHIFDDAFDGLQFTVNTESSEDTEDGSDVDSIDCSPLYNSDSE